MLSLRRDKSFIKKVLFLAAPVMLQQFITAIGQLVDNLMVGQLGEAAINGVGVSNELFNVVMFIGFGISEGASIFLAQQFGAKKFHSMHHTFIVGLLFSLVLGATSFLAITFFPSNLLRLYSLTNDSILLGTNYLSIVRFTYPIILFSIVIQSAFRATERTKIPMYCGILALLINTSLNYLLINGNLGFPKLGVTGAGVATLIARSIELIVLISIIYIKKVEFRPFPRDFFTVPKDLLKKIFYKTIPLIGNETGWALGMTTLMAFYGTRGKNELAALQMASTSSKLLFVVMTGFAVTISILIGQKLGKSEFEEAKREALKLIELSIYVGLIMTFSAFVLSFITPNFYDVALYTKGLSSSILRVIGLMFPAYMVGACSYFILRAGGDVRGVIILDSGYMWFITIPLAFLVTKFTTLGIISLFIFVQTFDFFKAFLGIYNVKKFKWLKNLNH